MMFDDQTLSLSILCKIAFLLGVSSHAVNTIIIGLLSYREFGGPLKSNFWPAAGFFKVIINYMFHRRDWLY